MEIRRNISLQLKLNINAFWTPLAIFNLKDLKSPICLLKIVDLSMLISSEKLSNNQMYPYFVSVLSMFTMKLELFKMLKKLVNSAEKKEFSSILMELKPLEKYLLM